jgi:hypothetical protein
MDDKLGKFCGLLGNFSDTSGSILSDLDIHVFKAVQDSWEDFSFNDNFGKVNGMLGNLGQALTDVSLQLGIWMGD